MEIMLVIIVIAIIPVVLLWVNRWRGHNLDKTYPLLKNGITSAHYTLKQIATTGTFEQQPIAAAKITDINDTLTHDTPAPGILLFDTLQLTFKIEQKVYLKDTSKNAPVDNFELNSLTIDTSGKVTALTRVADSAGMSKLLNNCISLNDELPEFPNWNDKDAPIYMRHFLKDEYHMPNLNPLRGLSLSDAGAGAVFYNWYGYGYYDLMFNNDKLQFKARAYSSSSFREGEYETGLSYYKLPVKYRAKLNIAFLAYAVYNAPEVSAHQLYMIKKQQ